MRVGGDRIIPMDVRIITSTYKDLVQEARAGRFRADLYFRIATLKLHSVPLRERVEDIEIIMSSLLDRYPVPSDLSPLPLSKEVHARMAGHSWPGNVRELDSLVQRFSALAVVQSRGRDPQALLVEIIDELIEEALPLGGASVGAGNRVQEPLKQQLRRREVEIIGEALRQTEDNKAEAARRLGISVNSLWRKLREE